MNFLKLGDVIEVIAPSSAGDDPLHLEKAINYYENLGYKIKFPKNMLDFSHPFHANEDNFRARTLEESLINQDSKIVWCWKGGYGASKLIPSLAKLKRPNHEKFFVGFSDITALHLFLNQKWGWKTIHGASFTTPVRDRYDIKNFRMVLEIIEGKRSSITYDDLINLNPSKNIKNLSGKITGGNLAMIEQSIGTQWQIDMTDKIVILEDVDESGYRVDRIFDHLYQAGLIQKAKAVVFGQFMLPANDKNPKLLDVAISNFISKTNLPTYRTKLIGHERLNIPFVYGADGLINYNGLEIKW